MPANEQRILRCFYVLKDLIAHLRNEHQAKAIIQAEQFKASMEELQKLAGNSEQELQKISQSILDMGKAKLDRRHRKTSK